MQFIDIDIPITYFEVIKHFAQKSNYIPNIFWVATTYIDDKNDILIA